MPCRSVLPGGTQRAGRKLLSARSSLPGDCDAASRERRACLRADSASIRDGARAPVVRAARDSALGRPDAARAFGRRPRRRHVGFELDAERIAAENRARTRVARGRLRASRPPARAPRRRHRGADTASDGLPRVGAVVGRGHGRHAVRAVSRTRRAPQRLREAGGLRGRLQAHAVDTRHLAAHPVGQAGEPGRAAVLRAGARALHRLDELQHLPGPARPAALLQVRQPEPHRPRRSVARRSSTTSSASSWARSSGPARTRSGSATAATSRGSSTPARPSSATSRACAQIYARSPRRLSPVHRAQALRAGLLLHRAQRLGRRATTASASSGSGRSRSSTSGTTRPTSTSR